MGMLKMFHIFSIFGKPLLQQPIRSGSKWMMTSKQPIKIRVKIGYCDLGHLYI